mmetsp:Transcript_12930/g.14327  ORF Transcript_12930/g.14327 Transcript_12930/m.14327 type:complete len:129 (+) Transcript_12930:95-481(+)
MHALAKSPMAGAVKAKKTTKRKMVHGIFPHFKAGDNVTVFWMHCGNLSKFSGVVSQTRGKSLKAPNASFRVRSWLSGSCVEQHFPLWTANILALVVHNEDKKPVKYKKNNIESILDRHQRGFVRSNSI